jgi:hypothetical protein
MKKAKDSELDNHIDRLDDRLNTVMEALKRIETDLSLLMVGISNKLDLIAKKGSPEANQLSAHEKAEWRARVAILLFEAQQGNLDTTYAQVHILEGIYAYIKKGYLSPKQRAFIERWEDEGGDDYLKDNTFLD